MEILKKKKNQFVIEKNGSMRVPVVIYATDKIMAKIRNDKSIEQGMNVASLPGIVKASIMMPDAHQGYGFPIGGVAAFDVDEGIITPGGIGFDINCGVRVLRTNIDYSDIDDSKMNNLIESIFKRVPSGVGRESTLRLEDNEMDDILANGVEWAIKNGYGNDDDMESCEGKGRLKGNPLMVSKRAKARGRKQLGTLGAGNHFIEIQYVEEIFDYKVAEAFGIRKNQIVVMIHTGSRGLGHQVCSDYLKKMEDEFPDIMKTLPEKDLIYAPFESNVAKEYFSAMNAAANFAWTNRHIIGHHIRQAFREVFGDIRVDTLYDVAHNIAKIEKHMVMGKEKRLIVHRKGATRAFPPGNEDIPEKYREVGQPVLIPGSMGTASYILVGTEEGMKETFGSSAHGAGRMMSRLKAKKEFNSETIVNELKKKNIIIKAASRKGIVEEAPLAYKDIDEVIKATEGISRVVARLRPTGVVKG